MNPVVLGALGAGAAAYLGTYLVVTTAAGALADSTVLGPLLWVAAFVAAVAGGAAATVRAGREADRGDIHAAAFGATVGVAALLTVAGIVSGSEPVAPRPLLGALIGLVPVAAGAAAGVGLARRRRSRQVARPASN